MRRPHGYCVSGSEETDTSQCPHCGGHFEVLAGGFMTKAMAGEAAWCSNCDAIACPSCAGKGCTPFMKAIEAMEARDRLMRSMGLDPKG